MQPYGRTFAGVYVGEFTDFVKTVAPQIESYYAHTRIGQRAKSILDLCCGTGELAHEFASKGYRVVGIDASQHMLAHAIEANRTYVERGAVTFIRGDVSDFSLRERFGLVVSTYDSINHLETEASLRGCFRSTFDVLVDGGYFVFDLNTRARLQNWNSIQVEDNQRLMMVRRGLYDAQAGKAVMRISGFVQGSDGLYERYEQTIVNTAYDLSHIERLLSRIGWTSVWFARIEDLGTPIENPEMVSGEKRVFVVALK
jgi:SAM-dependent methyltransferase